MKRALGGVLLGLLLIGATAARATTIANRANSDYGIDPYSSLVDITVNGGLSIDSPQPADVDEEIICPVSSGGCPPGTPVTPGNDDNELLLELVSALAPGTQITVDLGSGLIGGDVVSLLTCRDQSHSGATDYNNLGDYCTPDSIVPSGDCVPGYTEAAGNHSVTFTLPTDYSCTTSGLVFSIDEAGSTPTFGTVTTTAATTPEPGSLILLAFGMLPMMGLYRRRLKKHTR